MTEQALKRWMLPNNLQTFIISENNHWLSNCYALTIQNVWSFCELFKSNAHKRKSVINYLYYNNAITYFQHSLLLPLNCSKVKQLFLLHLRNEKKQIRLWSDEEDINWTLIIIEVTKKNVKTWNKSPLLCFLTRGMCKTGHWKRWNFWKSYWKVWFSSKWWTGTLLQITYFRIPNLVMFFSNFSIKKIKDKENLLFLNSLQLFEYFQVLFREVTMIWH